MRPDYGAEHHESLGSNWPILVIAQIQVPDSSSYPLVNVYIAIEHGPVEVVDFPIKES